MTLTVWSFGHTVSAPTGVCKVRPDYGAITCPGGGAFVDVRAALVFGAGNHVTRFSCRVVGRDDQGDLRCAPGKPTINYDATEVLRSFARKCALDVVHLWEAPPVVKRYLRTGDPKLRDAAWVAVEDAAWGAVWDATKADARAAARATTAGVAAGAAAGATTGAAAGAAAAVAAGDAARDAAWAAGGAARDAAGDTAWTAARRRQSRRLARMLQAGARKSMTLTSP